MPGRIGFITWGDRQHPDHTRDHDIVNTPNEGLFHGQRSSRPANQDTEPGCLGNERFRQVRDYGGASAPNGEPLKKGWLWYLGKR